MRRTLYTEEHEVFRTAFRSFVDRQAVPYVDHWENAGTPDRAFIEKAAKAGFLGFEFPAAYGGLDVADFRYNTVVAEEVVASGMAGDTFSMQNDIALPYLLTLTTDEQKQRWLPRFTQGQLVTAIAMTEPGAGSDLRSIRTTARPTGDELVINGSKTFITSGSTCDLVLALVTSEVGGGELSVVAVENGTPGFERGRPMKKIGRKGQDTAELFFSECRVPITNVVGQLGRGLAHIVANLPRERLSIAVQAVASAQRALTMAAEYAQQREVFGAPLGSMQSVRMAIGEIHTEVTALQEYLDRCVLALNAGDFSPAEGAGAKFLATELQWKVLDRTMQMFGGYGYMEESEIARMWRDARVQRIYGGANELLLDSIGKAVLGGR
ncbi:acyl-CoA dehydrogenase family protein [Nocardia sp. CA-120079]|uniref:acyl-CoA dehydrogenase family protein n=1 Tax=Nocardia sp. CA-120079 TaxID=3239974 RepID=UPI003D96F770